jgi:hypothetical protein
MLYLGPYAKVTIESIDAPRFYTATVCVNFDCVMYNRDQQLASACHYCTYCGNKLTTASVQGEIVKKPTVNYRKLYLPDLELFEEFYKSDVYTLYFTPKINIAGMYIETEFETELIEAWFTEVKISVRKFAKLKDIKTLERKFGSVTISQGLLWED